MDSRPDRRNVIDIVWNGSALPLSCCFVVGLDKKVTQCGAREGAYLGVLWNTLAVTRIQVDGQSWSSIKKSMF